MLSCPWDAWSRFHDADNMTRLDIQLIRLEELEPRLVVARFTGYDQYTNHFMASTLIQTYNGALIHWLKSTTAPMMENFREYIPLYLNSGRVKCGVRPYL